MKKQLRDRDWQDLSAYLDGQLSSRERARLEQSLASREDLRMALEELRRVRIILRSQPRLRAPRNFTLGAEFASQAAPRRPARQLSPMFGLVSALASVLLVLVIVGEFMLGAPRLATAPQPEEFQAKSAQVEMAAPPTEASLQQAPALPAAPQATPEIADQSLRAQVTTQAEAEVGATLGAPVAGAMEYPAPMAQESPTGAYPPPSVAMAVPETQPPAPEPTQVPLVVTEAVTLAQEALTQPSPEAETEMVQPQPAFWNSWRFAQVGLLLLAVVSGALALYWRRGGAP